jgi:hypothetical protein
MMNKILLSALNSKIKKINKKINWKQKLCFYSGTKDGNKPGSGAASSRSFFQTGNSKKENEKWKKNLKNEWMNRPHNEM